NTGQQFLTRTPLVLFFVEDRRRTFRSVLARLAENGQLQEEEVWLRPHNSAPIAVALTATYIVGWHGKPSAIRWLLRDSTKRRRAEAALRESEQLNRAVLDALAAPVVVLDQDGTIIAVN